MFLLVCMFILAQLYVYFHSYIYFCMYVYSVSLCVLCVCLFYVHLYFINVLLHLPGCLVLAWRKSCLPEEDTVCSTSTSSIGSSWSFLPYSGLCSQTNPLRMWAWAPAAVGQIRDRCLYRALCQRRREAAENSRGREVCEVYASLGLSRGAGLCYSFVMRCMFYHTVNVLCGCRFIFYRFITRCRYFPYRLIVRYTSFLYRFITRCTSFPYRVIVSCRSFPYCFVMRYRFILYRLIMKCRLFPHRLIKRYKFFPS